MRGDKRGKRGGGSAAWEGVFKPFFVRGEGESNVKNAIY